jgi:hypothetical protein
MAQVTALQKDKCIVGFVFIYSAERITVLMKDQARHEGPVRAEPRARFQT